MSKFRPVTGPAALREYIHFFHDPIDCMRTLHRRCGNLVVLMPIPFGKRPPMNVLGVGPEYNRQILGDPGSFRATGQFMWGPKNSAQQRLRYGLTRMNGPKHRQQRALVMPPFHKKAIASYHDLTVGLADEVLRNWRPGERYDMHREMRNLSLRISSSVLFGHDLEEALRIAHSLEEWTRRNFSAPVWLFPVDLPGTAYRRLLQQAQRAESAILDSIHRRQRDPSGRTDILSLLIQARDDQDRGMTDKELLGQAAILFGASFETSASVLTWTHFLLAQHPAVLHQLMDELDNVLGGAPPTREQLPQLRFLENVINESMRILPPVPFTIRATQRDIAMGPVEVPKNTRVLCSHYLTHHLPELYPEPERFRPERWENIQPSQYEFMPFSAGPRVCIGASFAFQVLKISLAMMLQKFRFSVVPGSRIDRVIRITMGPREGLPMTVHPNDRKFAASEVCGQIHEMVQLT